MWIVLKFAFCYHETKEQTIKGVVYMHYDAIYPGKPWYDTHGRRIQAHGASVYYEDGVYYWIGENKQFTHKGSKIWSWGIKAYSSTDLCN